MRLMALVVAVVTVISIASPTTSAIDTGTAEGSMTSDGITVPLTHALAVAYDNEEAMLEGPELRVLLTDREIAKAALSGPILDRLDGLARKGEVRGLVLRFDREKLARAPVNGTVLLAPADPETSLMFLTLSAEVGIEALEVTETRVTGKLAFSIVGDTPTESASARATFSAPLLRDEVSGRFTGAEAAASPPAQALARWNDALRRGDFPLLRSLSAPDKYQEVETFLAEVGSEAFRKMVENEVPGGEAVRRQIREVMIRGDRAFIVFEDDDARSVATASRVGDTWVVD